MNAHLSHYDLDGIGCQIVAKWFLKDFRRFNIGYGKIDEYLEIIEDFSRNEQPKFILITDLSFSIEQLTKLSKIAEKHEDVKYIFIDHHPMEEPFEHLSRSNFKLILDKTFSGTKLTYNYLSSKTGKEFPELANFVEIVNAYDLWKKDSSDFKKGIFYNELFWEYGDKKFFRLFSDKFTPSNSDKETYMKIIDEKNTLYKKLEDSGRIFKTKDKNIFMIFLDKLHTFVTLDYPDYKLYCIVNSSGKASVRITIPEPREIQDEIIQELKSLDILDNIGGHYGAFGLGIKDPSAESIISFAKKFLEISDKILTAKGH